MPEGPEVRILTEVLTTHILFKEIQEISFLGGRYVTHSPPKNYQEIKKSFPQKIISSKNNKRPFERKIYLSYS